MKKVYLIAVIMALVTGFAVYIFATNLQKSTSAENTPTTPVVVALSNISENTVLTEEMLEVKQLPTVSVTPGTARTIDEIVGMIAKYPMVAGEQIPIKQLRKPGSDDGTDLSYQLGENERAFTISVDEVSGVSGFIRAGDSVDIITTVANNANPVTEYLLQDVLVLKVSNKAANASGSPITSYSTVTLCVSPENALKLGEAVNLGQSIRLILRPITE